MEKKKANFTKTERKRQPHQRTHLSQRNRSGLLLLLLLRLLFALHLSFQWSKASNWKKNKRERKKDSGSRPLLAGYGLGTRIRATLAQTLIPGPDTDLRVQIRVRVLALKHGLFGLFTDFLQTFFGLDWYLKRYARVCVCEGGNCFY